MAALVSAVMGFTGIVLSGESGSVRADGGQVLRDEDMTLAVRANGKQYYVQISMLVHDDGRPGYDQRVAAVKERMLKRFSGAVPLDAESVTSQYVASGYWWEERTAGWAYNPAGGPALSGESSAIANGANTWASAGANFGFSSQGTTGAGTGACDGSSNMDGANTVGWADQGGSVLAVTCTWYDGNSTPRTALEFDMELDPGWNWTTSSSGIDVDLQSVATHEFGHALGLGHSPTREAVMYASYSAGTLKRTLHSDDIAGIVGIYGGSGAVAPTPTPTNTAPAATAVSTSTPTRTPTRTATPTATRTATSAAPTVTPTATRTATPTATRTPTSAVVQPTATPTRTATRASTPTATKTARATKTPTPTRTPNAAPTRAKPGNPGASGAGAPWLALLPGSNLLTWPGQDTAPSQALSGQAGTLSIVYEWDAASGKWRRYAPGLPPFVNSLPTLRQGAAYWFISTSAASIPIVQ